MALELSFLHIFHLYFYNTSTLSRGSQDFGCTGLAIVTILNVTQTSGLRLFGLTLNVKNSVVFQYPIQLVVAVVKHASNAFNNFILLLL